MSKELGTLVVVVLKARNLPDDHFYKQDVYTKVTLQGTTKKTKVDVKGGQHPEWDEELRFTVTDQTTASAKKLEISCWSKEPRQDGMVGKGELDISDTLRTGEFDDWVPLSTDKGQRGDIYLEMTWFAAGPPPSLSRRPSKLKPAERLSRPSHAYQPSLAPLPSSPPKTTQGTLPDPRRTSPKGDLPPLPEESGAPPPEALPSILRPGAGRPRPTSTSPHTYPTEAYSSTPYSPHRSSLSHDQAGGLPGLLRAGPPNGIPPAQVAPLQDTDVPSLSAAALGHSSPPRVASPPGSFYPPHSITPQPTHHAQVPNTQPISYQPPHTPQPPYIPPANSTPVPSYVPSTTPLPTATYHSSSPPPHPPTYGPQPAPTSQSPPYGPQQQPPSHVRHSSQSSIYPPQSPAPNPIPGFTLPLWGNQPAQPPPPVTGYNVPPAYPSYGFPPGPPPPQAYYAPPPPAVRPYSYSYPPSREPDFEGPPDPAKAARYQKPLPLPDDGTSPPTHAQSSPPATTPQSHAHPHPKPTRSTTLEDHNIALRLQQEEEQRLKTQEELDEELARKLDLELNLASDSNGQAPPPTEPAPSSQPLRQNSDSMPGSWYRHRA